MNYRTIPKRAESRLTIKNSKFIGILFPLDEEQSVETILGSVRKEFPKATHYCFAYRLRGSPEIERMSDDGEPSGTAGVPMLEVLKGDKLQDVLGVVVRYFGGTLLGTGGLVRAYTDSMKEAIKTAQIQEMIFCHRVQMEFDYSYYGQIEKKCMGFICGSPETSFEEKVRITASIPLPDYAAFLSRFESLTDRQGSIEIRSLVHEPQLIQV